MSDTPEEAERREQISQDLSSEAVGLARPKKPAITEDGQEFGVSSVLPIGSWASWSGSSSSGETYAENKQKVSIDKLVEMRQKDGQARALMRLFTLPVRSALRDSEWVAPEGSDGESEEVKFANDMWRLPATVGGMEVSASKFLRQAMLALIEGFTAFEEVYYIPKEGPLKGKVCLKKFAHRDSRTLKFIVDKKGNFDGIRQVTTVNGTSVDVKIPADKVWYYAANEEENPFYGLSYFESAWAHWDHKRRLYYISHIAAQMAAVPGRLGKMPKSATPTQIAAFKKAVEEIAFNTAMVMPEDFEVGTFNMNSNFDFLGLIDHHNHQMAKSVLAKFLDDEQRQVLIENGKGDASADFFVMSLEAIMEEIADSLTQRMMPKFIDWNFGSDVYPVFKFGNIADATKDVVKELLSLVGTSQSSKWTDEFIREMEKKMATRLGLDVDYDAVQKREDEEKAMIQQSMGIGGPPGAPQEGAGGEDPFSIGGGGFGSWSGNGNDKAALAAMSSGAYIRLAKALTEAVEGDS